MVVHRSTNSFAEKVKRLPHRAMYRREPPFSKPTVIASTP